MKDHKIEVFDEKKAVLFRNWTSEKFSYFGEHGAIQDENCRWNGQPYAFAPGESKFLPEGIAHHFAKHLTNKVLLKSGKLTDDHTRPSLYAKCFAEGELKAQSAKDLEFELMNLREKGAQTPPNTADVPLEEASAPEPVHVPVEDLNSGAETVEVRVEVAPKKKPGRPKKEKPNFE